jgi:hypothetical protein
VSETDIRNLVVDYGDARAVAPSASGAVNW